jgi:methionyl aminopeptidase
MNMKKILGINTSVTERTITMEHPDENDKIKSLEKAADIHKEVRRHLHNILKPGVKLTEIVNMIESKTEELSNKKECINRGIGFPVGLSLNSCAAHYHPENNDNTTLKKDDVLKIDFGTEINGWIIDSAFTVYFDEKHDVLVNAVKEATETGIKNAGIDVDINDWAKSIKEVMNSYEINPITNLGGHNIERGIIHGGYFLPSVPNDNLIYKRMNEGVYAIETFGSTSDSFVHEIGEPTIFRMKPNCNLTTLKMESTKKTLSTINRKFKTLPFTDRYLSEIQNCKTHLQILNKNNCINSYPPLCVNNGITAQYEHTIFLGENKKIIFSNGDDY